MRKILSPLVRFKNWFLKASWKKKIITIIVLAIAFYFVVIVPRRGAAKPLYTFATVTRGTVSDVVSESGNVEALGQVDVFSTSTGVITNLYIASGDDVKVGQRLFSVQGTATPEEKAAAFAAFKTAESAYNQSLNTYRDREASAQKAEDDVKGHDKDETPTQKATRTTAQAARDSAYDATKSAEASLKSASLNYRATQNVLMVSPIAGKVGNLSSALGDKVSAKTVVGSIPVLVVGNSQKLTIAIDINEVDRPKIKSGQVAIVKFTAIKDKSYEGKVLSVDEYGTNTSGVITYRVSLEVGEVSSDVKPGMTANVEIESAKRENTLTVPNSGVKAYQGGKAVQVLENNAPKFIPVKVGLKGASTTEILEGVTEGTQILTTAPKTVTPAGFFGGN